jgi:hypothetical protein
MYRCRVITSPISTLTLVLDKQGPDLFWQIVIMATRTSALVFASTLFNERLAILFFGVVSFFLILFYMIWLFRLADLSIRSIMASIITEIAIALLLVGGCKTIIVLLQPNIFFTIACVLLAGAVASYRAFKSIQKMRYAS